MTTNIPVGHDMLVLYPSGALQFLEQEGPGTWTCPVNLGKAQIVTVEDLQTDSSLRFQSVTVGPWTKSPSAMATLLVRGANQQVMVLHYHEHGYWTYTPPELPFNPVRYELSDLESFRHNGFEYEFAAVTSI